MSLKVGIALPEKSFKARVFAASPPRVVRKDFSGKAGWNVGIETSSLSSGSRHRAGRVGQTKFPGAIATEPNQNMWSVGPEEGTYFRSNLHCVVDAQSLQSLDVKDPIVEFALDPFVPVNTLPLTEHLFTHDESPYFLAPHRAEY